MAAFQLSIEHRSVKCLYNRGLFELRMLTWLLLCGSLGITLAQDPAGNAKPVEQVEQVEAVWLPVGLQVTDLSLLYASADKPADEPVPAFNSSLVILYQCATSMNLLVSLPKYLQDELSMALDNKTDFAEKMGMKVNITGNFTSNSTAGNSTLSPDDTGVEWPADDMVNSPLADELLDDTVHNVYTDEASNQLLQDLAPSLQGLSDEVLQRSFTTVRRLRTHFATRCRYDCIQGFCGYITIACSAPGLPCRWRRCPGTCVQCPNSAYVCRRRPNLLYENNRYSCDVNFARPNLFNNPGLGLRCGC